MNEWQKLVEGNGGPTGRFWAAAKLAAALDPTHAVERHGCERRPLPRPAARRMLFRRIASRQQPSFEVPRPYPDSAVPARISARRQSSRNKEFFWCPRAMTARGGVPTVRNISQAKTSR